MSTGTAKRERQHIREAVHRFGKPERVEREGGVIRGVKIIGLESVNGRRYTLESLRRAVPLYEGAKVNVDHPLKPQQPRSALDRFAWLENVIAKDDGLYGDLHLLDPEEPLARKLLNAAEKRPDVYGLSHNAIAEGETVNGIFVVHEIVEVRSVDLVADPATNDSLFEGRKPMAKISVREALNRVIADPKWAAKKKVVQKLMEGDADAMKREMEADDKGDRRDLLHSAMKMCEDAGDHETATKIHALFKPKAAEEDESDAEEDESDAEEDESDDAAEEDEDAAEASDDDADSEHEPDEKLKKEFGESKKRLRQLERKDKARDLCEAAGIVPDKELLTLLLETRTDDAMQKLVAREKAAQQKAGKPRVRSSGGSGGTTTNVTEATLGEADNIEHFVNALRG